jgi:uncharacterized protein YjbJ (UPF0337 family)
MSRILTTLSAFFARLPRRASRWRPDETRPDALRSENIPSQTKGREMTRERIMGEFTDKLQGVTDKVVGAVKESIGKATDNPDLEAEGKVQQLKGKGEEIKGKVKGAINDL